MNRSTNVKFNATNLLSNGTEPRAPCIYCWCMLLIAYIPIVTLTVTVLVAVIGATGIPSNIRFVLALAASLITIVGAAMVFLNRAILSSINEWSPSGIACRVYYWVFATGGTARLSFMGTYAVVVFVVIRHSNTAVRPIVLLLSVLAIWIFVIMFNAQLFSPQIVVPNFLKNSGCVPHIALLGLVYAVPFAIIFALVPIALAITLPCAAICFIKTNVMEGRTGLSKPMVKFALFLLLGNALALLGQATPVLLASLTKENGNYNNDMIDEACNYTNGILLTISFIPTPILILAYFKPVRIQLEKLLQKIVLKLCKCVRTKQYPNGHISLRQKLLLQ